MKRFFLISATFLVGSSAFAQSTAKCVTAPVTVSGNQVTITSSGNKTVANTQMYVYYSRRHHKMHDQAFPIAAISDKYPSNPLLLSSGVLVNTVPESYSLSLSTPQSNVAVCPDSAMNVEATINLEKVSSYTGNYPGTSSDNKTYKRVTKHEYKVAARKMRKIRRNEAKVARRTGTTVEARSANA